MTTGRWWGWAIGLAVVVATAVPALAEADRLPCTAGSSGIGDGYFPLAGNGGYDVQSYVLDLDLDLAAGAVNAGQAVVWAMAVDDLCAFNLDFLGPEIERVAVDGQPAGYERRGSELTIAPPQPIARGAAFVVEVDYRGALLAIPVEPPGTPAAATPRPAEPHRDADSAAGGNPARTTTEAPAQTLGGLFWAPGTLFLAGQPFGAERLFPVNGHPADKATYAFRLTVADPYRAVANGTLVETIDNGGTTTTVWTTRDPMASYLVTIHAGRIELEEGVGPNGLPLRFAFAQGVPPEQRAVFAVMPEMLAYLEGIFGPYPFESAGATVVAAPLDFALETQTLPIYGTERTGSDGRVSPTVLASFEETVAHEMVHQWIGNSVSPRRWQDVWLNEGFAAYGQLLWIEETRGVAARDERLHQMYEAVEERSVPHDHPELTAADALAAFGIPLAEVDDATLAAFGVDDREELAELPADDVLAVLVDHGFPLAFVEAEPVLTGDPGPANLFSYTFVYQRGALAVHALRQEVGDAAFFTILRGWPERFRNGNATVDDFIAFAEETSGRDLNELFDAWLYHAELPELAIGGADEAGGEP